MESFYFRDTWVEINLDAIRENVSSFRNFLPEDVAIIGVVKANAYGHGDAQVAKEALEAGATHLAVSFLDEAISLRQRGVEAPILVLGPIRPEDISVAAKHKVTLTVYRADWVQEAVRHYEGGESVKIHMKFDSGMGRLGIKTEEEYLELSKALNDAHIFELEGAYTHFATADELDTTYFEQQYERFTMMLAWFKEIPPVIHIGNSATTLRFPNRVYNAVRIGIGMYGLSPSVEMKDSLPFPLQSAFSLHSRLTHVKKMEVGERVSYGGTYTAHEEEWIGTVPVGYADGWIRSLQGFEILVDGKRAPIVGRICMDQFMVRLPHQVPVGTQVTLIGKQDKDEVTIDDVAHYLGTINYEVTCTISYRVPRMFLKNMSIMEVRNPLWNYPLKD